jgi:DUF2905 family protein
MMVGPPSEQLGLRARSRPMTMQKLLIGLGGLVLLAGLLWPFMSRLGLGRLPGDIVVRREGFTFAFPVVTCIAISVVLTLVLWLARR